MRRGICFTVALLVIMAPLAFAAAGREKGRPAAAALRSGHAKKAHHRHHHRRRTGRKPHRHAVVRRRKHHVTAKARPVAKAPARLGASGTPAVPGPLAGALAAVQPSSATTTQPAPAPSSDPRPFSPGSFWRKPLAADAAIDPSSAALVDDLVHQVATYGPYINTTRYTAPVYEVPADQPAVHVTLDALDPSLQAVFDAVPIPAGARGSDGTDSTAIVWQRSTDTLWELWRLRLASDGWHARWGGRITGVSTSDGIYPAPYGVAASGLSILGGMMRPAEFASGDIGHALSIAIPQVTALRFRWPATRTDGKVVAGGVPLGTRFRLDPSVDVSALDLPGPAKTIALAAQRYGLVVTDTAGAVCFGAEDPASIGSNPWPDLFGQLAPYQLLAHFPWNRLEVLAVPG